MHDLLVGVLEEFASFAAALDDDELAGLSGKRLKLTEPHDFDVEDPAAVEREVARLQKLAAHRSQLVQDHLERRREREVSLRPIGARCPNCKRRVLQPVGRGGVRVWCDERCRNEFRGMIVARCRCCLVEIEVPARGGIKLYCSVSCRDRVANRKKRGVTERSARACRLEACGKLVEQPKTGKVREFCDHRCRQKFYYWQKKSVA